MTYDPSQGEVLLFGGAKSGCYSYCGGYAASQVWAFKNGNWSVLQFGSQFVPESRAGADFIYVPQGGYDLLFGGTSPIIQNDVWTLALT